MVDYSKNNDLKEIKAKSKNVLDSWIQRAEKDKKPIDNIINKALKSKNKCKRDLAKASKENLDAKIKELNLE